jgi:hypothetical protein
MIAFNDPSEQQADPMPPQAAQPTKPSHLFPCGPICNSHGIQDWIDSGRTDPNFDEVERVLEIGTALFRHLAGDWGDLDTEDFDQNNEALQDGSRLFSAYQLERAGKIWVITEAADSLGQRAGTTILFPHEY